MITLTDLERHDGTDPEATEGELVQGICADPDEYVPSEPVEEVVDETPPE